MPVRGRCEGVQKLIETALTLEGISSYNPARSCRQETMNWSVLIVCLPQRLSREACAKDAHLRRFLNMRVKLVTFGITAVATLVLVVQASSQAVAQGNANKPAAKKKAPPAPPQAKPANAAPAPAPASAEAKPKPKPKPKKKAAMAGVPKGVPNCIKHLSQMAAKDPLIDYFGHPSEIINDGLLWNDPKSHCSVAGDDAMKKKVLDLADAWRKKDATQVRSILGELEASAK